MEQRGGAKTVTIVAVKIILWGAYCSRVLISQGCDQQDQSSSNSFHQRHQPITSLLRAQLDTKRGMYDSRGRKKEGEKRGSIQLNGQTLSRAPSSLTRYESEDGIQKPCISSEKD